MVSVPDVPGCFSAGDTLSEAMLNAKEAISFHIEGMLEDDEELPKSNPIEQYINQPEYKDFIVTVVDVDLTHLMGKAEKLILRFQRYYCTALISLLPLIQNIRIEVTFCLN